LLYEKYLAIVKSTVGPAFNLGLNVVAEGVELEEQRNALESPGCNAMQGFLDCHALLANELLKFFQEKFCFCEISRIDKSCSIISS
jgi:EAL domain-containing protein (putative c-di-GMP-specific phosphodiesterase class I)